MNAAWVKYLPSFIRTKLESRHGLQAIIGNTGWLFADKILRMGVGLFLGVWIARYLGPEQFGLWNYATAFTALFGAFATLGLDNIVIRELVKDPAKQNELLGSAFVLKLIGGAIALLIAVVAISLARSNDPLALWLVAISAAGFIFQSINVIDFYFRAKVQSKYTVYATNSALVLLALVKVGLILSDAPLIAFAWAGLAEIVLSSLFLMVAYRVNHQGIREWKFQKIVAASLLKDSWPLLFSSMAVALFMKIDQVMLQQLVESEAVGIYSAAVRVSEMFYFIGLIATSSIAPSIYLAKATNQKEYLLKLQKLSDLMVFLAIVVTVPVFVLSQLIINMLFGLAYAEASQVLAVHIWATLFVFVGSANSVYWTAENLQKFSLVLTIIAAVLNVILNLVLIPRYGVIGAAIATLISYGIPTIFMPFFSNHTRPVFYFFFRSMNFMRYL